MLHLFNRKPLGESVQHNPFKKGFYKRDTIVPLLPAVAFGVILTWLSLSGGVALPDELWSPDKLAHFGAYGLWAWLWGWGRAKAQLAWQWVVVALGCTAWGLLMEGVQGLMPWRTFEWADGLANALGAVGGIGMYEFFHNKTT